MDPRPRRRHAVSFPIFLIAGGIYLLAWNLDLTSWSPWQVASTFWPLLLVGLGLDLLLGRVSGWVAFPAAALVLVLLGMAVVELSRRPPEAFGGRMETAPVRVPLDGAASARIDLHVAGGLLDLRAGPSAGGELVSGRSDAPGGRGLRVSSVREGDELHVVLRSRARTRVFPALLGRPFGPERWDLELQPGVPLSLDAEAVAAQAWVDLSGLDVRRLHFRLEVGEGRLDLPEPAGDSTVRLQVTLGRLAVTVPAGVAARIVPETSLARVRVDRGRFERHGGAWQSPGFEDAARRLTVEVDATLGRVDVR